MGSKTIQNCRCRATGQFFERTVTEPKKVKGSDRDDPMDPNHPIHDASPWGGDFVVLSTRTEEDKPDVEKGAPDWYTAPDEKTGKKAGKASDKGSDAATPKSGGA